MILSAKNKQRILARHVIHRGITYELSIIEISGCDVTVTPFVREIAATRFECRTVRILREGYTSLSDWHAPGCVPILVYE